MPQVLYGIWGIFHEYESYFRINGDEEKKDRNIGKKQDLLLMPIMVGLHTIRTTFLRGARRFLCPLRASFRTMVFLHRPQLR